MNIHPIVPGLPWNLVLVVFLMIGGDYVAISSCIKFLYKHVPALHKYPWRKNEMLALGGPVLIVNMFNYQVRNRGRGHHPLPAVKCVRLHTLCTICMLLNMLSYRRHSKRESHVNTMTGCHVTVSSSVHVNTLGRDGLKCWQLYGG